MASTGGQPGNQNAAKSKRWRDSILRALARSSGSTDGGLDKAAEKLVSMAIDDGDKWAIDHIADRVDGKAHQSIEHSGSLVTELTREQMIERLAAFHAGSAAANDDGSAPGNAPADGSSPSP